MTSPSFLYFRQGSIIAIIEVYVVPIDSLTDPEDQALYTQLENDTSLQLIDTSFRESLTNLNETGQADFVVDSFDFSLPGNIYVKWDQCDLCRTYR